MPLHTRRRAGFTNPSPHGRPSFTQSTELTFTLLSAKSAAQPGPMEVAVPLTLRAGCADSPAVLLTLRAHVVMPDITTSAIALEFGTVCNAHCKVDGIGWGWLTARSRQGAIRVGPCMPDGAAWFADSKDQATSWVRASPAP